MCKKINLIYIYIYIYNFHHIVNTIFYIRKHEELIKDQKSRVGVVEVIRKTQALLLFIGKIS